MTDSAESVAAAPRTALRAGLRAAAATAVLLALLGPLAGLLWAVISPEVRYAVIDGKPLLADPESQAMIGVDGRFAVITAVAAVVCGVVAYLAGGRDNDIALVVGLAVGGLVAALIAWKVGHQIGAGSFHDDVRHAQEGGTVNGPADLRAKGVIVFWPMLAVATYALLEAVIGRLAPADGGEKAAGEPDQVGRGELDLEAAPTGRDIDGREP